MCITNGDARLLRDAELFKTRLGNLFGGADVADMLISVVQNKSVAAPAPSPAPVAAFAPDVAAESEAAGEAANGTGGGES